MRKPDFDFSPYVNVPEDWIEKALAIPASAPQKPKVVPFSRRYIAAASIVLVAVLGVSAYFLFGNKNPIPVTPKPTETVTETPTITPTVSSSETTKPTKEEPTTNATEKPSSAPTQPATQIATDSSGNIVITTVTTRTGNDSPSPTSPVQPTQKPSSPSTKPQEATEAQPTVPVTVKPTEPVMPDIRTVEVILPILDPVAAVESDDDALYCCVYDSEGDPLGDSDLYSSSHRLGVRDAVEVGYQSDAPCYYYSVDYDANQIPDNCFTYKIYLHDGTVLEEGTVFV